MKTLSKRHLVARLVSGAVVSLAAMAFVWALEIVFGITDRHTMRMLLAALAGAMVGFVGRMFVDEVSRN